MRKVLFIVIAVVAGIAIIALMVKTVEKNAIQNQKMLAVKKAERKKRDSIKNSFTIQQRLERLGVSLI